MIKFFRKIRQKLLTENKFRNYLLYALGEIILVVLGILIALQINNWSEVRKNENIEYQYLNRLKTEFESTLIESNETYSYSKEYKRLSELLLKVISTDTVVNLTELVFAIETTHYGTPPTVNQKVWQDITNSGNSGILKNADLRFLISDYYQILNKHWNMYNGLWAKSRGESGSINSTILAWQDRELVFNSFSDILKDLKKTNMEFSMDYNTILLRLKKTPLVESTTMSVLITHNVDNIYIRREIKKIQEIINAIALELERWN